jgi:ABC-type transport system substrate-binding protein
MRDAMNTVDSQRRRSDYAAVQHAIASQLPVFTLWQVQIPNAYHAYVHGIAPSPAGSSFWNAWNWTVGP